jgi:hypothetical protein
MTKHKAGPRYVLGPALCLAFLVARREVKRAYKAYCLFTDVRCRVLDVVGIAVKITVILVSEKWTSMPFIRGLV